MAVRKRGDKWIVDIDFRHATGERTRVRQTSPVQTRRGAEEYERQVRAALLAGTWGKAQKPARSEPTLSEFAETHLDRYVKVHNKDSTLFNRRSIIRGCIVPRLGHLRLSEVAANLESYVAGLVGEGIAPRTVNARLSVLKAMLRRAHEQGLISTVPAIRYLKPGKGRVDFLSAEERESLCAVQHPLQHMVRLAVDAGLRRGELLALRWQNVDFREPAVHVVERDWKGRVAPPKGGKARTVPLTKKACAALLKQHVRTKHATRCWPGVKYDSMDAAIQVIRAVAGIDRPITWHTLRHTFASHLVMAGVPLPAVQVYMGHSDIVQTMRYAHLAPAFTRSAIRALDEQASGNVTARGKGSKDKQAKKDDN